MAGFYGNITNIQNTNFQFDRIYSNRASMDSACENDGVFVGRHVLVEYDIETEISGITYYGKYINSVLALYPDNSMAEASRLISNDVPEGKLIKAMVQEIGDTELNLHYYYCSDTTGKYPVFKLLPDEGISSSYISNYQIDKTNYGADDKNFRGYDSTVWIKVSKPTENGESYNLHYVQVADLNSVVPDFDVKADAPTPEPIAPHFDADTSSNLHYDLHVQTPYGFRIKEANINKGEKSDVSAIKYITTYNKETNEVKVTASGNYDAAIYFNEAGFDSETPSNVSGDNFIKVEPSGKSDNKYSHGNDQNDIQEMSISLPAIGNAVSKVYDVLHGEKRDNDKSNSLKGVLQSFTDLPKGDLLIKNNKGEIVGAKTEGDNYIAISTSADETAGKLVVKHKEANVHVDAETIDLNNPQKDSLTTYFIDYNDTGHISEKINRDITLPYGYKYIKAGDGTSAAINTQDIYEFKGDDNYIEVASVNDSRTATISHKINDDGALTSINIATDTADTSLISGIITDKARHIQKVYRTDLVLGDSLSPLSDSDKEIVLNSFKINNLSNGKIAFNRTFSNLAEMPTITGMISNIDTMYKWGQEFSEKLQAQIVNAFKNNGLNYDWETITGPEQGPGGDSGSSKLPIYDETYGYLIANMYKNGDATIEPIDGITVSNFSGDNSNSKILQENNSAFEFTIKEGVITDRVSVSVYLMGLGSIFTINGVEQTPASSMSPVARYYEFTGVPEGELYFKTTEGSINFATFIKKAEPSGGDSGSSGDGNEEGKPSELKEIFDEDGNVLISNIISNKMGSISPSTAEVTDFSSDSTYSKIVSTSSPLVLKISGDAGLEDEYMTINVAIGGTGSDNAYMQKGGTPFGDVVSTDYSTYFGNNNYVAYSYTGIINGELSFYANSGTQIVFSAFKKAAESGDNPIEIPSDLLDENRNINLTVLDENGGLSVMSNDGMNPDIKYSINGNTITRTDGGNGLQVIVSGNYFKDFVNPTAHIVCKIYYNDENDKEKTCFEVGADDSNKAIFEDRNGYAEGYFYDVLYNLVGTNIRIYSPANKIEFITFQFDGQKNYAEDGVTWEDVLNSTNNSLMVYTSSDSSTSYKCYSDVLSIKDNQLIFNDYNVFFNTANELVFFIPVAVLAKWYNIQEQNKKIPYYDYSSNLLINGIEFQPKGVGVTKTYQSSPEDTLSHYELTINSLGLFFTLYPQKNNYLSNSGTQGVINLIPFNAKEKVSYGSYNYCISQGARLVEDNTYNKYCQIPFGPLYNLLTDDSVNCYFSYQNSDYNMQGDYSFVNEKGEVLNTTIVGSRLTGAAGAVFKIVFKTKCSRAFSVIAKSVSSDCFDQPEKHASQTVKLTTSSSYKTNIYSDTNKWLPYQQYTFYENSSDSNINNAPAINFNVGDTITIEPASNLSHDFCIIQYTKGEADN